MLFAITDLHIILGFLVITQFIKALEANSADVTHKWVKVWFVIVHSYFSPLALSVKRVRQGNFNPKVILVIMAVVTVAVVGAMNSSNSTALLISTSIFVLTTIAGASIFSARMLAKVAGSVRRWHYTV